MKNPTPRQALNSIGRTKTQVFDKSVVELLWREYAVLEKLVEKYEEETK